MLVRLRRFTQDRLQVLVPLIARVTLTDLNLKEQQTCNTRDKSCVTLTQTRTQVLSGWSTSDKPFAALTETRLWMIP